MSKETAVIPTETWLSGRIQASGFELTICFSSQLKTLLKEAIHVVSFSVERAISLEI